MENIKGKKQLSAFTVAATYIGTVVGAGFASGQEVLQFFGFFGLPGLVGLIITTVLLAFFGYIILDLGRRLKAESHLPVIRYAGGKWVGRIIDWTIVFFLFGGLVAMAAGGGAIFVEQFGLPFIWGSLLMIVVTLATVLIGFSGVIASISFVVPVLLVSVFGLAIYTLSTDFSAMLSSLRGFYEPQNAPVPFWPLTAVLYVSYNLVLAVAILGPLGARSGPGQLKTGAVLGGLGLGLGAAAINLSVLTYIGRAGELEIPMLYVAGAVTPAVSFIYTIVLLVEVYTTAVGSLFGFVARFTTQGTLRYRVLAVITGIVAFGFAQLGFSNLVSILYPAVGAVGLLLLAALTYGFIKERIAPAPVPQPVNKMIFETGEEFESDPDR